MADKKNIRQKVLLPTLKERQRYIVYSIQTSSQFKAGAVRINEAIIKECNTMLGVFDAAKAGLMNVKYDESANVGMMRVEHNYVDKVKVCLGMINDISTIKVNIDCVYVSGMLNKAQIYYDMRCKK